MIISNDAAKAFGKIQHPFIIKIKNKKNGMENFLHFINSIHKKPTTTIILYG